MKLNQSSRAGQDGSGRKGRPQSQTKRRVRPARKASATKPPGRGGGAAAAASEILITPHWPLERNFAIPLPGFGFLRGFRDAHHVFENVLQAVDYAHDAIRAKVLPKVSDAWEAVELWEVSECQQRRDGGISAKKGTAPCTPNRRRQFCPV